MIAGTLTELITIEEIETHVNEYGEVETDNYKPKIHTRAEVTYNNGNRLTENNEVIFAYSVTFTIRLYHNVVELDRVKWQGKDYRILSIERDKKFQLQRLRCELINQ